MILDGGLGALLFIAFAILAALSGLGKAGKGTGMPRRRLPGAPPPSRTGGAAQAGAGSPARGRSRSADVLIPDDLWAMITGERRVPGTVHPSDAGATGHVAADPSAPARSRFEESPARPAEAAAWSRVESLETSESPGVAAAAPGLPVPVTPSVVSGTVAEPAATPASGGAAPAPAGPMPVAGPARLRALAGGDLRRAILLATILGPPKALE